MMLDTRELAFKICEDLIGTWNGIDEGTIEEVLENYIEESLVDTDFLDFEELMEIIESQIWVCSECGRIYYSDTMTADSCGTMYCRDCFDYQIESEEEYE